MYSPFLSQSQFFELETTPRVSNFTIRHHTTNKTITSLLTQKTLINIHRQTSCVATFLTNDPLWNLVPAILQLFDFSLALDQARKIVFQKSNVLGPALNAKTSWPFRGSRCYNQYSYFATAQALCLTKIVNHIFFWSFSGHFNWVCTLLRKN